MILGFKEVTEVGMGAGGRAKGLRILSLDGGGVKGIIGVRLLARLEEELGLPLWRTFDLIVGTSAGGIIATSVSRY